MQFRGKPGSDKTLKPGKIFHLLFRTAKEIGTLHNVLSLVETCIALHGANTMPIHVIAKNKGETNGSTMQISGMVREMAHMYNNCRNTYEERNCREPSWYVSFIDYKRQIEKRLADLEIRQTFLRNKLQGMMREYEDRYEIKQFWPAPPKGIGNPTLKASPEAFIVNVKSEGNRCVTQFERAELTDQPEPEQADGRTHAKGE